MATQEPKKYYQLNEFRIRAFELLTASLTKSAAGVESPEDRKIISQMIDQAIREMTGSLLSPLEREDGTVEFPLAEPVTAVDIRAYEALQTALMAAEAVIQDEVLIKFYSETRKHMTTHLAIRISGKYPNFRMAV